MAKYDKKIHNFFGEPYCKKSVNVLECSSADTP